jgi:excisionase family DNA binding protein
MLLTTEEVAKKLGITRGRVIQLIHEKVIPYIPNKFSSAYQIEESDLESIDWKPRQRKKKNKKWAVKKGEENQGEEE